MYEPTVPAPRRRPRTVALVVGLTLLALCVGASTASCVGAALSQANNGAANVGGANGTDSAGNALPGFNQAVRDGKFEFVVTSVSCGHDSLVNGFLRSTAQGQFCVVSLQVANIGTEPRQFADGNQRAYGPDGTRYAADTGAGVTANGNGAAIWNVINPGNSITAKVVYDIALTASIATLELHDSGLSRGVVVSLATAAG